MNNTSEKHPRILAIYPTTVGFGFAVIDEQGSLFNWGVKVVEGDKNSQCLARVKEMIAEYRPNVIVLEDASVKDSKRGLRTRMLTKKIVSLASRSGVDVALYSHKQIRESFFADGKGTKHALAEIVAQRFPDKLGHLVPPKRRDWESEYCRMAIFDAVALALTKSGNSQ